MKFLEAGSEPVRRWIYGVAVSVIAGAVLFGLITGEQAAAVGAVVAAVLLAPVAEIARAKVSPANADTAPVDETNLS